MESDLWIVPGQIEDNSSQLKALRMVSPMETLESLFEERRPLRPSNSSNVFQRLLRDTDNRYKKQQLSTPFSQPKALFKPKMKRSKVPIEDRLLQKAKQKDAKLNKLRLVQEEKAMRELQRSPSIKSPQKSVSLEYSSQNNVRTYKNILTSPVKAFKTDTSNIQSPTPYSNFHLPKQVEIFLNIEPSSYTAKTQNPHQIKYMKSKMDLIEPEAVSEYLNESDYQYESSRNSPNIHIPQPAILLRPTQIDRSVSVDSFKRLSKTEDHQFVPTQMIDRTRIPKETADVYKQMVQNRMKILKLNQNSLTLNQIKK